MKKLILLVIITGCSVDPVFTCECTTTATDLSTGEETIFEVTRISHQTECPPDVEIIQDGFKGKTTCRRL